MRSSTPSAFRERAKAWFKRLTADLFYRLLGRLSDVEIPRDVGDFRLVDRKALDCFLAMPERDRFVRGMFVWIGFRQAVVQFHRPARAAGETKYSLPQDASLGGERPCLVFRRSLARGALGGSGASAAARCSTRLWVVGLWAMNANLARGWSSIILVMTFLGGANMLMTGVLGVYIGRIHTEVKRRPLYVVDRAVGFEAVAEPRPHANRRRRSRRDGLDARDPGRDDAILDRIAAAESSRLRGEPAPDPIGNHARDRADRGRDAALVRHARRRLLVDHDRREMAQRPGSLRRFRGNQSPRVLAALLAGGLSCACARTSRRIRGLGLRLRLHRREPRAERADPEARGTDGGADGLRLRPDRARRASWRGVLRTRPSGRRLRPALSRALNRARRAGGDQIFGSPRSPASAPG